MDKFSRNSSSDRLNKTHAACPEKLQQHRKKADREKQAREYQSLQLHQDPRLPGSTTDQLHQASAEKSALTRLTKEDLMHQLDQALHENENLRQKLRRDREVKDILKKAMPELPKDVETALNHLQGLHRKAMDGGNVSNDEHRKAFEELLGHLSPETLQDCKRRGIEFVVNPNAKTLHPTVGKNAEGKWQIKLPIPYKHGGIGIQSMMLRTIDKLLATQQQQDGYIPSPERRAEIAIRAFQANDMLGEYRLPTEGYKLAEKYRKDCKDGIRKAFEAGLISKDDPKEKLIKIGYAYANDQFLESIKPPQDIPRIFPSMQPGSYFEEYNVWAGQQPVKVGSLEFDTLMETLKIRQQKEENSVLTANILLNDEEGKEILVQPYYIFDEVTSRHPMNAKGGHSVWAGEIDIDNETKRVLRLKDQSGHYRTFDKDHPDLMARTALKAFQELGYDTSTTMIELTAIEGPKNLEYKNYKPPTREDLKDSGGRTSSEQYIDEFRQKHGTNEIKDITQIW